MRVKHLKSQIGHLLQIGFNNYVVNVGPSLADNIPATDTQFNNYFVNVGPSLADNIPATDTQFNNYVVNVGPSLADNIPATDTQFSQYLSASTNVKNSLFLNPVTDVEMLQLCSMHTYRLRIGVRR